MSDKGRPDDDDDEQETIAGGASTPGAGGTQGDFGLDDLESLPGKRPTPAPKPPARPAPSTPPGRGTPDPTSPDQFAATTPPSPDATVADSAAVQKARSAEVPTREMDVERELPTIVGSFASSKTAPPKPSDEMETIADVGPATNLPTGTGASKTPPPAKTGKPFVSPLSNVASRTARDPIVGSAASRGTHSGATPAGPHALAEGLLLADRYELIERLGKGGMGEVWKARHILLQGHRAIKVIKASISRDPAFRQRFLQEGQTMMRVKHPGVVEVTDLDETRANRELFMVMEYLKGRTIYDAVRDKGKPLAGDVRDSVRILIEVANGMQRIHDERIVHKDLKSDNVLLVTGDDGKEHPKVIDFGLAKRLGDNDVDIDRPDAASPPPGYDPDLRTTLSGTLAYMAPEQFRNQPSSFQSDIYAFGVMAYEVFNHGEFPLPRGSLVEYLKLHEAGKAPEHLAARRPDLDPRLTAIFDGCLAMKREARPESFKAVAKDLQYWLDTPEREARRRKVIYSWAGTTVLAASAIWGFFFSGEKTATLSNLTVAGGGTAYSLAGGKTLHLPAAALAAFEFRATIGGKPGVASLEIDDRSHAVSADVSDGKFVARADLSALADGEHRVAIKPSAGAIANEFVIAVDRAPPKLRGVSVQGAVTTKQGLLTKADAPIVVVDLDEPTSGIAEVYALAADRMKLPGEREKDSNRFLVSGTAPGDGKVEFDVIVHDLAGNETSTKLSYVRDTKAPDATFTDHFNSLGYEGHPSQNGVWLRSASGAKLIVTVGEPSRVEATFGGSPPIVGDAASAGQVALDVPSVPTDGFEAKVSIRDIAGNETTKSVHVGVELDGIRVMDISTSPAMVVRADDRKETPIVIVARAYPLGDSVKLWATRLRKADGSDVANEPTSPANIKFMRPSDEGKTYVYFVPPGAFEDGVYKIDATVPDGVACVPLTLTSDSTAPIVESVSVADDAGRPLAADGWALAPDVVVTAVVSDLALSRIDLDGTAPREKVGPGRRTYTFAKRLDHEGVTTWTLALTDAAGHPLERAVTVRGDWTAPEIASLDAPLSGATVDDITAVKFVGRCTESAYRLVVEGAPGGASISANCVAESFAQPFLLPATDGPVALRVVAIDPAGHASAPKVVTLSVVHRRVDRAPEITWRRGVEVKMEKVVAGDVVLAASAKPVIESYLDKTEVTNAQYRAFLAAAKDGDAAWRHPDQPKDWSHVPPAATWGDPKWNADDLPVVNVAYWDAYAFAKWSGRRLPTEAEWVKAAAKSTAKGEFELRQWPSIAAGEPWKDGVLATSEGVKGPVSAVVGDDVSPNGCLHMGGNVSEWIDLASTSAEGGPQAGTRGGNWYFTKRAADVRNTPGKPWDRSFREKTIGFRCAVDADQVAQ